MEHIHVQDSTAQLVDMAMIFRAGTTQDPEGLEGLAYVASEMLLRGTQTLSRQQIREEVDHLGTSLSADVGNLTLQISGDAASRNFERLVELVRQLLLEPVFPEDELQKVKRQTIAESREGRDSDATCAAFFFTQMLFHGHPLAHPMRGYEHSVARIEREHVVDYWKRGVNLSSLLVGTAGHLDKSDTLRRLTPILNNLPQGRAPGELPRLQSDEAGLDVLLVRRKGRNQAQIAIGQEGVPGNSPHLFPLLVGVTGFGGTFTSVLVREIREKRGWSYGVGAALMPSRGGGLFRVRYAPKNEDVLPSIQLTLELLNSLKTHGLEAEELDFAKEYLVNQYPFMVESATKRLNLAIRSKLTQKPSDYVSRFREHVREVTPNRANSDLNGFLQPDRQRIVVVGDPSLEQSLAKLHGVRRLRVVEVSHDGPLVGH